MEHAVRPGAIFDYGVLHLEWPTAAFIAVVFLLTMFLLNLLLFKPLLRTLEGRETILSKSRQRLGEIAQAVTAAEASFQAKQTALFEEISSQFQEAMADAQKQAGILTEKARLEAQESYKQAEAAIEAEVQSALSEAKGLAQDLARLIQTKVLR